MLLYNTVVLLSSFTPILAYLSNITVKVYNNFDEKWEHLRNVNVQDLMAYSLIEARNVSAAALKDVDFPLLPFLETLKFYGGNLEILKPECFSHLPNLKVLLIKDNKLRRIVSKTFEKVPLLAKIIFAKNRIAEIEEEVFNDMQDLEKVDLSYNEIETIKPRWFSNCDNLRQLYLSYNRIVDVPDDSFRYVGGLTELVLDHNRIKSVGENSINHLMSLAMLYLGQNEIDVVPDNFFAGLDYKLWYVDLNENHLTCLSNDTLNSLSNGIVVFLFRNKIDSRCEIILNSFVETHPKIVIKYLRKDEDLFNSGFSNVMHQILP